MSEVDEVKWESYEKLSAFLLTAFAKHFGFDEAEGKQRVAAQVSTTRWQLDGKLVREADDSFLIIECKRFTKAHVSQEIAGGLAWRIIDTGAEGGIIVSPHDFQKGAAKVATATNITHFKLTESSTIQDFQIEFGGRKFGGGSMGMFMCGGDPELPEDKK